MVQKSSKIKVCLLEYIVTMSVHIQQYSNHLTTKYTVNHLSYKKKKTSVGNIEFELSIGKGQSKIKSSKKIQNSVISHLFRCYEKGVVATQCVL